ncbi:endonuclease VII domain-containing protein [Actinoplanes rectilineatus]|uniref:endonuclease VII domain-containing protein n=1 Tax=Actinoplanes rectilineatus TaxID=113571 RepID=UPI003CCBC5B0
MRPGVLDFKNHLLVRNDGFVPQGHKKHRLSNVDPELLLADCAECGPGTKIRRRPASDRGGWRCQPGSAERRPRVRKRDRTLDRLKKYDLTVEQLRALVEAQGNRCAICLRPPVGENLDIDHCHKTGKVRALLCRHCNTALGLFAENHERLLKAAEYLRNHAP